MVESAPLESERLLPKMAKASEPARNAKNPICGENPPSRAVAAAMMSEAQSVASQLGVKFRVSLEKRIAGAEKVGHHKTSMLQDVEAARTLEVDAVLGSVVELARRTNTPTPHIDTVYALTKLLARTLDEKRL